MSPRSAALVSTTSAVDAAQVLAPQTGPAGDAVVVPESALAVGAPGWTRDHHVAAEQRQAEALTGTIKLTPLVGAEAAPAASLAFSAPTGVPTAAESAAVDALFDQAARINVVLMAFVLMAVAAVLAVVLTRL